MSRYSALVQAAHREQLKLETDSEPESVATGPLVNLWLVVALPANDFSKKIEYNEELGLLLAPEGKFIGFAHTREELHRMTTSKLEETEARGEPEDGPAIEVLADYVYLTYRAEFRGTEDLQKLLEFLLVEGMLKPQTS